MTPNFHFHRSNLFAGLLAGFLCACGGAWKDTPYEGFKPITFLRSIWVGAIAGVLSCAARKAFRWRWPYQATWSGSWSKATRFCVGRCPASSHPLTRRARSWAASFMESTASVSSSSVNHLPGLADSATGAVVKMRPSFTSGPVVLSQTSYLPAPA